MKTKAQAALEYLITYGWALVLVATVVGTIVFIIGNPLPDTIFTSSNQDKIMLISGKVDGDISKIMLKNLTGGQILITSLGQTGDYSTASCSINGETEQILIPAGATIPIECTGMGENPTGTININYTNQAGLERTAEIEIQGTIPKPPECIESEECEECQICENGFCLPAEEGSSCNELLDCQHCIGGECVAATVDGSAATLLGCIQGDTGCRKCTAGVCGFYTSEQHECSDHECYGAPTYFCPGPEECNLTGNCGYNLFYDPRFVCDFIDVACAWKTDGDPDCFYSGEEEICPMGWNDGERAQIYNNLYETGTELVLWQDLSIEPNSTYRIAIEFHDYDCTSCFFQPVVGGIAGDNITEQTPNIIIERVIITGDTPENRFKLNAFINGGYVHVVVRSIRLIKIS